MTDNLRSRVRRHEARVQVQDEPGTAPLATKPDQPDAGRNSVSPPRTSVASTISATASTCRQVRRRRSSRRTSTRSAKPSASTAAASTSTATCDLAYLSNPGNQFAVNEYDTSYFVQLDFDYEIFGHRLFGNAGIRDADTRVRSIGYTTERRGDGTASARSTAQLQRQPAVVQRRLSAHRRPAGCARAGRR